MGLASSQARLLLITSRKSDLEYRATQITQRKLLLATKSEQVATDYSKAVANKCWVMNTFDSKGNASQIPMTAKNLDSNGYVIKDSKGNKISVSSQSNASVNNTTYLAQKLESGEWHIENPKAADNKVIDLNSDAQFSQILDESDDTAAEAKYQSESLKLQNQDKQLDLELKQIETQHKALETEYDSVKKVMDKNIDVSFKIFAQG